MVKNAILLKVNENVNIGLYFFLKNNILFSGVDLKNSFKEKIKKILNVDEIVKLNVSGTPYPGLFLLDYKDKIIVPKNIFENEKKVIEKYFKTITFNTEITVLKNNILLRDDKALISNLDESLKKDFENLNIKYEKIIIDNFESIGSLVVFSKDKDIGIIGIDDKNVIEKVESFFNTKLVFTTINNNSPFLNSGLILGEGIILGEDTMPLESQIILENL